MSYDVVISTSALNCYGSRILTNGINLKQYKKNPVLLWMHERGRNYMPIGRVENLRVDDDKLIGTLVFDEKDEFASKIKSKWDGGFIKMVSASVEGLTFSDDPKDLLPGQWRATITKCKLIEVSVVDIGGNDDALRFVKNGNVVSLSASENCEFMPLLELKGDYYDKGAEGIKFNYKNMDKILLALGLPVGTSEDVAVAKITALKESALEADKVKLTMIETSVDVAIADRRITADKREHFVNLGKTVGLAGLNDTLSMFNPVVMPTEAIGGKTGTAKKVELSYGEMSEEQLQVLAKENKAEYVRLFKAEFGYEPEL